jgi:hypothetical protein
MRHDVVREKGSRTVIRGDESMYRWGVHAHVKSETHTGRNVGEFIKRSDTIEQFFPFVGNKRGVDDE